MPYQSFELLKKCKKTDLIPLLDEYYKSIGRINKPDYHLYSLRELKNCIIHYEIELKIQDDKNLEEDKEEQKINE